MRWACPALRRAVVAPPCSRGKAPPRLAAAAPRRRLLFTREPGGRVSPLPARQGTYRRPTTPGLAAHAPLPAHKIPPAPPLGGVLVWSGLDYTLVFCLLGSLLVLIGYLQRTSARLKKSTEARLTQAMAERGALREFTAEGAWGCCARAGWLCPLRAPIAGRRAPAPCRSLLSVLPAWGPLAGPYERPLAAPASPHPPRDLPRACTPHTKPAAARPPQSCPPSLARAAPFTLRWTALCLT